MLKERRKGKVVVATSDLRMLAKKERGRTLFSTMGRRRGRSLYL